MRLLKRKKETAGLSPLRCVPVGMTILLQTRSCGSPGEKRGLIHNKIVISTGVPIGLWPTPCDEKGLGPATTLYATVVLSFVIPSVPGFPASPLSPATTYVVLPKENHMQLAEAVTLNRKSGEAEGSAVPRTFRGNFDFYNQTELSSRPERTRISCHAELATSTYAPLRRERRMRIANATKFDRKSGERSGETCGFFF
jgi:hypothetical protein